MKPFPSRKALSALRLGPRKGFNLIKPCRLVGAGMAVAAWCPEDGLICLIY